MINVSTLSLKSLIGVLLKLKISKTSNKINAICHF